MKNNRCFSQKHDSVSTTKSTFHDVGDGRKTLGNAFCSFAVVAFNDKNDPLLWELRFSGRGKIHESAFALKKIQIPFSPKVYPLYSESLVDS